MLKVKAEKHEGEAEKQGTEGSTTLQETGPEQQAAVSVLYVMWFESLLCAQLCAQDLNTHAFNFTTTPERYYYHYSHFADEPRPSANPAVAA